MVVDVVVVVTLGSMVVVKFVTVVDVDVVDVVEHELRPVTKSIQSINFFCKKKSCYVGGGGQGAGGREGRGALSRMWQHQYLANLPKKLIFWVPFAISSCRKEVVVVVVVVVVFAIAYNSEPWKPPPTCGEESRLQISSTG